MDENPAGAAEGSPVRSPRRRPLLLPAGAVAVAVPLAAALADGRAAAGLFLIAEAAAILVWWRPWLLAPLVAVLLPAGERFDVLGVQASPLEAAVGGGGLAYVVWAAGAPARRRLAVAHWVYAAFCAAVALSLLGPADVSARLRDLLLWGALGAVLHAAGTQLGSRSRLRVLLAALALATVVEAALALGEYVDGRAERFSLEGGAIVFPLPRGTLDHPNALAQFLVLALLLVLALALVERAAVRRAALVVAVAAGAALVVTYSRGSWIAASAGGAVWLLDRRARLPVLVVGCGLAAGAAAAALLGAGAVGARIASLVEVGRTGLAGFRVELVGRALDVIADHPLTGVGRFEEAGVYAGRPDVVTHPHNLLLGVAVFYGIPAALAFAALLGLAFAGAWTRARAAAADARRLGVGLLAVLVALVVNGLFEYPFWHPALATLIVLVLGLSQLQLPVRLEARDADADEAERL